VLAVVHDEHHAVRPVVRGGNGLDHHASDSYCLPGPEVPKILDAPQSIPTGRPVRLRSTVDRQAELSVQDAHAAGVVHVVIGDEDGIYLPRIPVVKG
jgi:hypothetical protein